MKSTIFCFKILLISLVISCGQVKSKENNQDRESEDPTNSMLLKELNDFVSIIDSVPRSEEFMNVILVDFFKKNNEVQFTFSSSQWYKNGYDEHLVIEGYLVVFYKIKLCNFTLLEGLDFLKAPIPEKYYEENSAITRPFESIIRNYKIVGSNKISLIDEIRY